MARLLTIAWLALALLGGCSATYYQVATHGGQTYTAVGRPDYDEDAKTYTFEQTDGKKVILNQRDVKEIKQQN